MIVGICDDDIVLRVDGDPAGLRELSLQDPELTELAVVDHLLALYLDSEYQFRTAAQVEQYKEKRFQRRVEREKDTEKAMRGSERKKKREKWFKLFKMYLFLFIQ